FHFTADFGVQPDRDRGVATPFVSDAAPNEGAAAREGAAQPAHVLLVEDNPVNRKLAECVLEKAGYRVSSADSGAAALSGRERDRFDLVLMDVQMPGMDGIEATKRIRDHEKLSGEHIPVLALTAHAMPGDRARCLAAGMDGYLIKPIQRATLLDAVARLHGRRAEPRGKKIPDGDALMETVEGDAQLRSEIVNAFSGTCGELMSRAREAMESRDAERLASEMHTLQGMFRSLSAVAALEEARKLESLAAG